MMNKILIVEDNPQDLNFLQNSLKKAEYQVVSSDNGERALSLIEEEIPDLVILDIILPGIDGFEICQRIRQNERFVSLPVLFFTSRDNIDDKLLGLELGASDFLSKNSDERELLVRIRNLLRSKKLFDEMVKLSVIDSLTHVYNRRYFQHRLIDEFERGRRYSRDFCCIIVDVDNFKTINDTLGHPTGDNVLKKIAAILRRNIRAADVLCRYGGDEFGLLLPETNIDGAYITAERVRRYVEKTDLSTAEQNISMTLSCGISSLVHGTPLGMDELVTQADVALYRAKKDGRNQTRIYGK